ncbi:MAG: site-specific DNA-methyltransferase [Chloroflexi bacterium CFX1]|nr:site-specific DNA-methyltransferase [Chloroflexi bacterium CFX1]
MSFNSQLIDLLKTDPRFVDDEEELILAAVQDRAWKIDHDLIRLLLSKKEVKAKFFDEIEGHWVFNINTFLEYISQKDFLDNSYTRFRNRIGLTIDGKFLRERGEVALVWPYKDAVLEGGQTKEEEKRKEIFFNEVLAQDEINRLLDPKVLTGFTRYTAKGKEKVTGFKRDENGVIRENLILKGNNLLALHTLKSQFRGKVKLIYIDPPYNTGNDSFGYNDNFNHSTWLTFMKNRLEVARDLLSNEGILFVQCDDKEQAYLRVILDDIFSRDNHLGTLIWEARSGQGNTVGFFAESHEYIFCFAKNRTRTQINRQERVTSGGNYSDEKGKYKREQLRQWGQGDRREDRPSMYFPIPAPDGKPTYPKRSDGSEGRWRFGKTKIEELLANNDIDFEKDETGSWQCYRKIREGKISTPAYTTFLMGIGTASTATLELKHLFGEKNFGTPKPESLLQQVLEIGTQLGDIVLDFQLGSGTTAAVAHKMGRQYIGIEQMDYIETIPVERLKKVIKGEQGGISGSVHWQGGGDFIYCELMKYNEAYMERIQAAKSSQELVKIWREMAEGSFLNWYVNPEMPEEAVKDFEAIGDLEKQKRLLAELLDKNQLYVNLSEMDDAQFKVSAEDKALNKAFYGEG